MKRLLLALCILATISTITAQCDACFDNNCYKKTSIFAGLQLSGQMAIDRTSNIIYFHFLDSNELDYNAVFDLDYLDFQLMHDIGFTFAHAVDQTQRDAFLSAAKGVLKFNRNTTLTQNFGLDDKTIWYLQFKDKLYYVQYNVNGLFYYENGESKPVRQNILADYAIDDFVVDKNDDIYFLSDRTVYRLGHDGDNVTVIANNFFTLSTNKNGDVYFVKPNNGGLYRLDSTNTMKEIGVFGDGVPFKVLFDSNNNVIYHDTETERLFYLIRHDDRCRVIRSGNGNKMAVRFEHAE